MLNPGESVEEGLDIPEDVRVRIFWQLAKVIRDPAFVSMLSRDLVNGIYMMLDELPRESPLLQQPCDELRETVKFHIKRKGAL